MYLFVFLVEMLHVGSADATARKCRRYSKERPMPHVAFLLII